MVEKRLVKHRFISPENTLERVRKLYRPVPQAVCFDIQHRGEPNTRVWAEEFETGCHDGLLRAIRYARGDRMPPRYFTVERNPDNPGIGYINIYF